MRYPFYTWCLGRCNSAVALSLIMSCLPHKETTACGRVLFWVLSPLWLAYTIAAVTMCFATDLVRGVVYLVFCCGCTCKLEDCQAGEVEAWEANAEPVFEKQEPLCTGAWWTQLHAHSPDCCCNEGGCFSMV